MVQENYMCSWTDHSNYFFNSISTLRLNEILTDVTITCGDKYFQAHKLVLCASSEYFRSILANNIEKLAIVHIVGVPPIYIQNILQYLYTGQIEITPSDVEPFLRVANDLKICGLYKDDSYIMPSTPLLSGVDGPPEPDTSITEPESLSHPPSHPPSVASPSSLLQQLGGSVTLPPPSSSPSLLPPSNGATPPMVDPGLMRNRFKNPVPLDELRIKKKVRGSEPTLGNSIPNMVELSRAAAAQAAAQAAANGGVNGSSSGDEKPMEQSDGHMEHHGNISALSSLANAAAVFAASASAIAASNNSGKEENNGSREEITILPDIVDLNEDSTSDEISAASNKESSSSIAAAKSGQSSRGQSPMPVVTSAMVATNSAATAAIVAAAEQLQRNSRSSTRRPHNLRSSSGGDNHRSTPSPNSSDAGSDVGVKKSSTTPHFPIRANSAIAIDPAAAASSGNAVINTRSATMNKRKSIPTKLVDASGGGFVEDGASKKSKLGDPSTPTSGVLSAPIHSFKTTAASLLPISTIAATISSVVAGSPAAAASPLPGAVMVTAAGTPPPAAATATASPLTSLTTSSLNSPYLRSSSNPCKGLVPLNCRKGHNGNHCNHVIIPLPDGRKAHYSKQDYEQWLKTN
eukprot:TRINITY_DN2858_c0_g1_i8.p1 TRINITY_DN2858_c0_g1~~TRINITY_DN2858_c0_g1_i8.p1  ORF type:complete len:632 (-),score=138.20 TRINITY_DN2858_c0_g1_i8:922-2817(-)